MLSPHAPEINGGRAVDFDLRGKTKQKGVIVIKVFCFLNGQYNGGPMVFRQVSAKAKRSVGSRVGNRRKDISNY
jgi:hypothetical protein